MRGSIYTSGNVFLAAAAAMTRVLGRGGLVAGKTLRVLDTPRRYALLNQPVYCARNAGTRNASTFMCSVTMGAGSSSVVTNGEVAEVRHLHRPGVVAVIRGPET